MFQHIVYSLANRQGLFAYVQAGQLNHVQAGEAGQLNHVQAVNRQKQAVCFYTCVPTES